MWTARAQPLVAVSEPPSGRRLRVLAHTLKRHLSPDYRTRWKRVRLSTRTLQQAAMPPERLRAEPISTRGAIARGLDGASWADTHLGLGELVRE